MKLTIKASRRQFLFAAALVVVVIAMLWAYGRWASRPPQVTMVEVVAGDYEHPADIQFFNNGYVITQLFSPKLAVTGSGDLRGSGYLDLGIGLASPHFVTRFGNGLLVTDGWGSSIAASTIQGKPWRRFGGPGDDGLLAPHGICTDAEGWIYVADSLKSRLVRFRGLEGSGWQVFPDAGKRISYGRQLLCREDGVWLSNSYERREGLNPGNGGNILRIEDFDGGDVTEIATFPHHNTTGIAVINDRWLIVGLFNSGQLILHDMKTGRGIELPRPASRYGPPYGMRYERDTGRLLVAYPGDINHREHAGGIGVYRVQP